MDKSQQVRRTVQQALGATRPRDLREAPYFILVLGPAIPEDPECPRNAGLSVVGGHKRRLIMGALSEEGYTVLTGEELAEFIEEVRQSELQGLPAFAQEQRTMGRASAIIIIPASYGSCVEMGQVSMAGEAVCGRTLVLEIEETIQGYSHTAVETAATLGANVECMTCEHMRQCGGLRRALEFAHRMHKRYRLREALGSD
jgi:hypothetical protein